MSIYSTNPDERIFIYENSFSHEGKKYTERFYFLIDNVEYDNLNEPVKVSLKRIEFIESYLNDEFKVLSDMTVPKNIPHSILKAVKEWETTKNLNKS